MILYHFTSPRHIAGCRKEGLRLGSVPIVDTGTKVMLLRGYQWCTTNPERDQSWAQNGTLPYDRTAYRLTISIPRQHRKHILVWLDICDSLCHWSMIDALNSFGDPENWRLYHGIIYPSFIKQVEQMPPILIHA